MLYIVEIFKYFYCGPCEVCVRIWTRQTFRRIMFRLHEIWQPASMVFINIFIDIIVIQFSSACVSSVLVLLEPRLQSQPAQDKHEAGNVYVRILCWKIDGNNSVVERLTAYDYFIIVHWICQLLLSDFSNLLENKK